MVAIRANPQASGGRMTSTATGKHPGKPHAHQKSRPADDGA